MRTTSPGRSRGAGTATAFMDDILERIGEQEGIGGLLLIAACSALEYLFPPFPGDAVSLLAAFLVAARGWSMPLVLAAMTGGSLVGSSCHWALGLWLSRRGWQPKTLRGQQLHAGIQRVANGFARHGAVYLAVNRFFPAMRAFFFLTAGWVQMPYWKVALWGGLSALAWNTGILSLGWVAGTNRDRLEELGRTYATIAYGIALAVVVLLLARLWWKRRRGRLDTREGGDSH